MGSITTQQNVRAMTFELVMMRHLGPSEEDSKGLGREPG